MYVGETQRCLESCFTFALRMTRASSQNVGKFYRTVKLSTKNLCFIHADCSYSCILLATLSHDCNIKHTCIHKIKMIKAYVYMYQACPQAPPSLLNNISDTLRLHKVHESSVLTKMLKMPACSPHPTVGGSH